MPFYETIFEGGEYSIANYETDEEAIGAATAHTGRAVEGQKAGSWDGAHQAQRVRRILVFPTHPGESPDTVSDNQVKNIISQFADKKNIDVHELCALLRDEVSPLVISDLYESNYKMEPMRELEWQS